MAGGAPWATELLQTFALIIEELRTRKVCRSGNNPVADYTEWLVCKKLGLAQQGNSKAGYDAIDAKGIRYQIKARRLTHHSESTQLSMIRRLATKPFDFLIGVIFESDFSIRYAAKIPHAIIEPNCRFSSHSNAHIFRLTPAMLKAPGVVDLTKMLSAD